MVKIKDYAHEVLESTRFVVANSEHVHIEEEGIERFCRSIASRVHKRIDWLKESPFPIDSLSEQEKAHLMLTFNSLSFSYWDNPYWQVTYQGTTHQRGSWSLIASMLRAKEEGFDILNPTFQANITRKDLEHILRGNTTIPLLDERLAILHEVGAIIRDCYSNDFRNMLCEAHGDAINLLSLIIENFPLFEDTANYKGRKISFYKRAQALVESIDSLQEKPLANSHKLTALADYILPRKMRDEGILKYSDELAEKVDNNQMLLAGSNYEVEIRANTIRVVEKIKHTLAKNGINFTSKEINDYIWLLCVPEITPHHHTRTTAY